MKTRNGKIARLPKVIRDELNQRLENGETGKELAVWLNQLPEVQHVLAERFGGRAINEQNMSEWKQGGFQEWMWERDDRSRMRQLMTEAEELGRTEGAKDFGEHLELFVALELSEAIDRLDQIKDSEKRWEKASQHHDGFGAPAVGEESASQFGVEGIEARGTEWEWIKVNQGQKRYFLSKGGGTRG